jgi:thioredoxin-related protein
MKKYLVGVALLLNAQFAAAFAPSTYDLPSWFKQSFLEISEDVEEAQRDTKRVILFFGQNGCPYCKKLVESNWSDSAIADYTRSNFDVIALNILGAREVKWIDGKVRTEKELAEHLQVRATPTLIFLDEKGGIVERATGYDPPTDFLALLKKAAPKKS